MYCYVEHCVACYAIHCTAIATLIPWIRNLKNKSAELIQQNTLKLRVIYTYTRNKVDIKKNAYL